MQTELTYAAFESRYRNKQYIGSGGFAKVFKVFDHAKNHYVALKVSDVRPDWKKFTLRNEVELVNRLPQHRNIARYDACYRFNTGFTGEMDFAILRFYEYGNLEQFLNKQELTADDKKLIIHGILDGVNFLHKHKVIHRDLKAQNILLHREDGIWTPKIADFGLGREIVDDGTVTNSSIGISYAYAAPEQIQNKKIYRNVDLWAAGVIIYRIIAGELPFKGKSDEDDKSSQSQLELSRKIVSLELPEKLETIAEPYRSMIKRCLVLDPSLRVQNANELIAILKNGATNLTESNVTEQEVLNKNVQEKQEFNPIPIDEEHTVKLTQKDQPKANISEQENVIPPVENKALKDYPIPVQNRTQISIPAIVDEKKSEPVFNKHKPLIGEPKSGIGWWWIALPLLLIGIAGGIWTYYPFNPTTPTTKVEGLESPRNPSGVSTEIPDASMIARFAELDEKLIAAGNSKTRLERFERNEIIPLLTDKSLASNYRLQLLMAKLKSRQGNYRETLEALKLSAETAIRNRKKKQMLNDLEINKNIFFEKFKNINNGTHWNLILEALK